MKLKRKRKLHKLHEGTFPLLQRQDTLTSIHTNDIGFKALAIGMFTFSFVGSSGR